MKLRLALAAAVLVVSARAAAQSAAAQSATAQSATAQGASAREEAARWLERAEACEAAADPECALDAWTRARDADPRGRLARRADRRIEWLEGRREGELRPLAALMRFQALGATDAETVAAFEELAVAMPEGRVRIESRIAIAGAWARLGEHERARAVYRAVIEEPGLRDAERGLAREAIAQTHGAAGDEAAALAELEDAQLEESGLYREMTRRARARVLEPVAWTLVALFALVALAAVARSGAASEAVRAALRPSRAVLAVWLGIAPWLIAHGYEDESEHAFETLAPAIATLVSLSFAAGAALPRDRRALRAGVATLAATAVFAAAYLAVRYRGDALPFG